MKHSIQIFKNEKFGIVRTVEIDRKTYFVGRDVASALGYEKPHNALTQHVDIQDTLKRGIPDNQGLIQETILINESGMYSLIFGSKLNTAKEFKRWVTSDVLPSIRKHGMYATAETIESMIADPENAIKLLTALQIERAEKERYRLQSEEQSKQLKESAPKLEYYENTLNSTGYLTINSIALCLGISNIKLNKLLCEWHVQYRQGDVYYLTSKYRNMNLAKHIPYPYVDSHTGETKTRQHLYWTEQGKKFILEVYAKKVKNTQTV